MKVPLFDLSRVLRDSEEELRDVFDRCLNHTKFISGPEVALFEQMFAKKVDSKHCVGMSSGTDALQAIFMALDLPEGSEVLVPSFTFVASASSIVRAGYKPVFVDLEKNSFHPSIRTIEEAWRPNVKAVLYVHLFGFPEDISEVRSLCESRGAVLIEDCAQSFGSTAGSTGLASAYSFFPAKNLGCLGDGGAVTTDSDELAKRLKTIRTHGSEIKYNYELLGGNFRLDTLQAGFLSVLLEKSDDWIEKRRGNALFYSEQLAGIDGLSLPAATDGHAWNQYTLITNKRNELEKFLKDNEIGCAVYYPIPLHYSSKIFGKSKSLPETERRCKEVISIPVYPGLKEEERIYVVNKIKEFFNVT